MRKIGRLSGEREDGRQTLRSRKGFGYDVRKARKRTRNVAVRDLVGGGVFGGPRSSGKYGRRD